MAWETAVRRSKKCNLAFPEYGRVFDTTNAQVPGKLAAFNSFRLFSLRGDEWIPQLTDWKPRTQTPVKFDLTTGEARRVWEDCLARLNGLRPATTIALTSTTESLVRYADPRFVQQKLGQATFRIAVLDAYGRACAVTGEHSLPAIEAAHIRSYADDGPHEITNGLLLRADLHRLFDTGYVTVTPELCLEVSPRLREDYRNGRSYYPLHGSHLSVPDIEEHRPGKGFLEWHNQHIYRA